MDAYVRLDEVRFSMAVLLHDNNMMMRVATVVRVGLLHGRVTTAFHLNERGETRQRELWG